MPRIGSKRCDYLSVLLSIKVCVAGANLPGRGSATRSSIASRPVSKPNRRDVCGRSAAAHRAALLWVQLHRAGRSVVHFPSHRSMESNRSSVVKPGQAESNQIRLPGRISAGQTNRPSWSSWGNSHRAQSNPVNPGQAQSGFREGSVGLDESSKQSSRVQLCATWVAALQRWELSGLVKPSQAKLNKVGPSQRSQNATAALVGRLRGGWVGGSKGYGSGLRSYVAFLSLLSTPLSFPLRLVRLKDPV